MIAARRRKQYGLRLERRCRELSRRTHQHHLPQSDETMKTKSPVVVGVVGVVGAYIMSIESRPCHVFHFENYSTLQGRTKFVRSRRG
jgi:hypothetical protein